MADNFDTALWLFLLAVFFSIVRLCAEWRMKRNRWIAMKKANQAVDLLERLQHKKDRGHT